MKKIEYRAASLLLDVSSHESIVFFFLVLSLKGQRCLVSRVNCLVILCRPATKIRPRCFSPELNEKLSLLQTGPPETCRWNRRPDELGICFWREANHALISVCKLWKIRSLTILAEEKLSEPDMSASLRVELKSR